MNKIRILRSGLLLALLMLYALSGYAYTVYVQTSTGIGIGSATVQYSSSSGFGSYSTASNSGGTATIPAGYNYVRVVYNNVSTSVVNTSGSDYTFHTTLVTLNLKDHSGNLLAGGTAQFYTGSWNSISGTTVSSGTNPQVELLPGSYIFSMNYNYYTQQTSSITIGTSAQDVNFQTTLVTLNLKDHNGNLLAGGTAEFYTGSWHGISGTTVSSGTNPQIELLPGNYIFNMNYNYYTQQTSSTSISGTTQDVNFQTVLVTMNLKDHSGNMLAGGAAQYYTGSWHSITGTTVSSGTNPQIELLPGSYIFNMNYNYYTQQTSSTTISGTTQDVNFHTTLVSANLKNCAGDLINTTDASAQYYTGSWHNFPSISGGTASIELLPGSYIFNMTYNYYTQQLSSTSVGSGPTQGVDFNTTKVTFNNASNSSVSYYTASWHTFSQPSMELLPGSYIFKIASGSNMSQTVSGCSQSYSIAPCSLAIDTTKKATCSGYDTLIAPAGSNSYSWSPGSATTQSYIANTSGTYSVTVAYDYTCAGAADGSHTISTIVTVVGSPITVTATQTHAVSCHNGNDGAISVTASGGTAPLTYNWSPSVGNSATVSSLSAGAYSVTVSDNYGCSGTSNTVTLSNPDAIIATASLNHAISCHSGQGTNNDGAVTVNATGGTGTLTYSWSPSGGTNATASGLSAGSYSVTVTDANTCSQTSNSVTLSEPTAISGTATIANNISCHSGQGTNNDGSVTISATGGTGTLSYNWSPSGGNSATASGLSAGSYSVTVTDGNNCSMTSNSVTLSEPQAISATITGNSTVMGTVTNTYTGPAGMATYSWSVKGAGASIVGSSSGSSVNITTLCNSTADTIMLTVTNDNGCSASCTKTVTVTPSSTITVYSTLYETGTGKHPSISKVPLASDLKVFNRHTVGRRDANQNHYSQIWNGTSGLVTGATITGPVSVNIGGGTSYRYIITVPAGGHYLVIGKSQVSSSRCSGGLCTIYTGSKSGPHDDIDGDDDRDDEENNGACTNAIMKFHTIIKDNNGKCSEGTTQQEHGSLMLMVTPATVVFDDSVELLPVVYESVEGDWDVTVSAEPPTGFYSSDSALSTSVTDSVLHAVQFTITDTGSDWTYTKLTHTIQHKGATRTAQSLPLLINERETPTEIIVSPNPAGNQASIQLPRFEGKATLYIYNLAGQMVIQKNINISRGASVNLDLSHLVAGNYFVVASNDYGKVSCKLVIMPKQ
jgi:hypothetical protein